MPTVSVRAARIAAGVGGVVAAAAHAPILWTLAEPAAYRLPLADWLYLPGLPRGAVPAIIALWVACALAFAIGRGTRIAGGALCLIYAWLLVWDQRTYANTMYTGLLATALLTVASVSRDPRWPLLLLRVQGSVIYGFAALSKANLTFLSGAHLARAMNDRAALQFPPDWRVPSLFAGLAVATVLLELFLAVGFWHPRLRPAAWLIGIPLHLGFVLLVEGDILRLTAFGVFMMALWLAHGPPTFPAGSRARAVALPPQTGAP